ncbi:MAG: septum formation protein Maf [Deltaproteobacteria bacterium]|nr:septum formation protein Maf [Deltaproteobacteria bacterium]
MFKLRSGIELILASASPRRLELLTGAGLKFKVIAPDVDESQLPGESPQQMTERLALLKAGSIAEANRSAWILAADTIVVLDGEVLGKPSGPKEAEEMLSRIQGRYHTVIGGFAIVNASSNVSHAEVHSSRVKMAALTPEMAARYVKTGEPLDKAGSYAIQGIGAGLVEEVQGSYTNVVGLNLSAVLAAFKRLELLN